MLATDDVLDKNDNSHEGNKSTMRIGVITRAFFTPPSSAQSMLQKRTDDNDIKEEKR